MSEEIKEILVQLKDSIEYPKFEMPTFDGSDFDYVDNDTFLEPDKCKILLDYINNLQNQLQQEENIIKEVRKYIKKHSQMTNLQINGIENVLSFRGSVEELLEIVDKGE